MSSELFNTEQAADYLGLKPHTLELWRHAKRYDVPYVKIGKNVRYLKSDLDDWLASRRVAATA